MASKLEVTFDDKFSICSGVCPFRVSSEATVVDDSKNFATLQDPLRKLEEQEAETSTAVRWTAIDWYRFQSFTFGATCFRAIEKVLESVEQNPSGHFELNLDRCGFTNLHIQIALDALLNKARPECLTALHLCRNRLFNPSLSRFLGNVLQELQTIAHLSVSYNTLDDECIRILSEALSNSGVRRFEAEHCQITDRGGSLFFAAMAYSDCIEMINLSWNHLERVSGIAIGKFLSTQRTLVELHLAGNQLYPETSSIVPLLLGLIGNQQLTTLDLSWNGLRGEAFSRALLKAVPQSTLKWLNLEHNLLDGEEMQYVGRMLKKSETMQELRLGGNTLEEEISFELARIAGKHPSLNVLSFGQFYFVSKRTAKLCMFFSRKAPTKRFVYQGVLMNNPARPVDVQVMLLERCRFLAMKPKKAKQKRDFGHLMLQLRGRENMVLSRDEFMLAVKQFRAKLDRALVESLMDAFVVPKQCVDVGAMANRYLALHPTDPPVVKTAKGTKSQKK